MHPKLTWTLFSWAWRTSWVRTNSEPKHNDCSDSRGEGWGFLVQNQSQMQAELECGSSCAPVKRSWFQGASGTWEDPPIASPELWGCCSSTPSSNPSRHLQPHPESRAFATTPQTHTAFTHTWTAPSCSSSSAHEDSGPLVEHTRSQEMGCSRSCSQTFSLSWPDVPRSALPELLVPGPAGPLGLCVPWSTSILPQTTFGRSPKIELHSCNPLKRSVVGFPCVQTCSFPFHPCEESCISVGNNPPQSAGCSVSPLPCLDGCHTLSSEIVRELPVLVSWSSCPSLFPTSLLVPCFLWELLSRWFNTSPQSLRVAVMWESHALKLNSQQFEAHSYCAFLNSLNAFLISLYRCAASVTDFDRMCDRSRIPFIL